MHVINRHGEEEPVSFDKILKRLQFLSEGLNPVVDLAGVTQKVVAGMCSGITTFALDELAAQTCAAMALTHPDYSKLAARLAVDNLHKQTSADFTQVVHDLFHFKDKQGRCASMIHEDVYKFIMENKEALNKEINNERDFDYDYFGFKTLERSYLLRIKNAVVERPQHMLMRVSCGIHCGDLEKTIKTYHLLSKKYFTHATPTLFNSGTPKPQMSSCFLLTMQEDSIEGIFNSLKQCALISKTAGGIGISMHCIRGTNSYIRGTNGRSNGLVPMLRVFNNTARYVDQGGGKRKGSFAIYLEPWHTDIYEYLELRRNDGSEESRCRDLFCGLWVPDLFMKRVESGGNWTLMCPNECPGLDDCWGDEFEALYMKYEKEGRGRKQVKATDLWKRIMESQIETGQPYMLYKDACNRKSNQKNLGTIKSSNLCTEIIQYTSPSEVAVCNLASLALPKYVDTSTRPPTFNHQELYDVTKVVTANLNRVIDRNYYPVKEAEESNFKHRPVGLGVQGLADAFMLMRYPFESEEAKKLNREIFETLYFAACEASMELAKEHGPYATYHGSPASEGLLQFDLWNNEYTSKFEKGEKSSTAVCRTVPLSGRWDWAGLKSKIKEYGLRNSLLVAPMPTASTSQILGNNEAFEPYTSNMYSRRTLSGEFCVVNPHLIKDLMELGIWNEQMKMRLVAQNGSVQKIPEVPDKLKDLYKTVWEIKQKTLIDMAVDRGHFIDQSQSLNIHMLAPTYQKMCAMHFHGWKSGLKTGVYYLRTRPAAAPIKFTVDHALLKEISHLQISETSLNEKKAHDEQSFAPPSVAPSTCASSMASPTMDFIAPDKTTLNPKVPFPTLSKSSGPFCPRRPKGMSEQEHCDMCSG